MPASTRSFKTLKNTASFHFLLYHGQMKEIIAPLWLPLVTIKAGWFCVWTRHCCGLGLGGNKYHTDILLYLCCSYVTEYHFTSGRFLCAGESKKSMRSREMSDQLWPQCLQLAGCKLVAISRSHAERTYKAVSSLQHSKSERAHRCLKCTRSPS